MRKRNPREGVANDGRLNDRDLFLHKGYIASNPLDGNAVLDSHDRRKKFYF